MSDVDVLKKSQRKSAMEKRKTLVDETAGIRAAEIFLKNITLNSDAKVSLYWPIGSELDTRPLIQELQNRQIPCYLPVVEKMHQALIFREWKSGDPLVKGKHDIAVPAEDAKQGIPDIIVTPLLAFDDKGFRMGYGGGFYDRSLEKIRLQKPCIAVGFAYAGQEIEKVVTSAHDQKLDWIVTEKEIRKIA